MIHKLPDDLRLKFYDYIANYGLFGIEPVVEGLEESIWNYIKGSIDNAKAKYNASVQNGYKGGRPPKNPIEPSENLEKPNETYFNPEVVGK